MLAWLVGLARYNLCKVRESDSSLFTLTCPVMNTSQPPPTHNLFISPFSICKLYVHFSVPFVPCFPLDSENWDKKIFVTLSHLGWRTGLPQLGTNPRLGGRILRMPSHRSTSQGWQMSSGPRNVINGGWPSVGGVVLFCLNVGKPVRGTVFIECWRNKGLGKKNVARAKEDLFLSYKL